MYWRLGPDYHRRPRDENRAALAALVADGPPPGLLAFDGGQAVGWCQLTPRAALPWLVRARATRSADDAPVWAISCLYVRRTHRHQGVMAELIAAAVTAARQAGAPAVQAYPVDTAVPGHTSNTFTGTAGTFRRAGFATVAWNSPSRPVMRLPLQ